MDHRADALPRTDVLSVDGFTVAVRRVAGRVLVELRGELDAGTASTLADHLAPLAGSGLDLEVDLRHLTFLDCAGVSAILRCADELGGQGDLVLRSPSASTARLLALLDLGQWVRIEP